MDPINIPPILAYIPAPWILWEWICQWPFQDPKLEVPTIYKAYFLGLCKGISPENMALYGTVPPF